MHQTIIDILKRGMPEEKTLEALIEPVEAYNKGFNTCLSDIKSKLPSIAEEVEKLIVQARKEERERAAGIIRNDMPDLLHDFNLECLNDPMEGEPIARGARKRRYADTLAQKVLTEQEEEDTDGTDYQAMVG